jgi:hypothetical protein
MTLISLDLSNLPRFKTKKKCFSFFFSQKNCELVTAGELFGRSGYGIGLQKGSPWTDHVTLAILDFHESEC